MLSIKKINIFSLGKILMVMYTGIGLLVGCFFSLTASLGLNSPPLPANTSGKAIIYTAIFSMIIFPVIFGAAGFAAGMIGGGFFNFAARLCGGLKVEASNEAQ